MLNVFNKSKFVFDEIADDVMFRNPHCLRSAKFLVNAGGKLYLNINERRYTLKLAALSYA